MTPIRHLTIHCAATPEGRALSGKQIADIGRQRFGQPSYHWVIEIDGTAVRCLADEQRGAHVGGANTGNIGICYVGGVDKAGKPKDTRTAAQSKTLRTLVRTYQARFPGIIVRGHREWPKVAKACPSFDVAAWLKAGMPAE